MRVLITGASGSGTSTFGRALALRLGCAFYDTDDYYWLPTEPPFQCKQNPAIRADRLLRALRDAPIAVLAGSIMNWGIELEDSFSLIVFLTVPTDVRVRRLREREMQRFGTADPAFLTWAAQYDQGTLEGRSLAKHNEWLSKRSCPCVAYRRRHVHGASLGTGARGSPSKLPITPRHGRSEPQERHE